MSSFLCEKFVYHAITKLSNSLRHDNPTHSIESIYSAARCLWEGEWHQVTNCLPEQQIFRIGSRHQANCEEETLPLFCHVISVFKSISLEALEFQILVRHSRSTVLTRSLHDSDSVKSFLIQVAERSGPLSGFISWNVGNWCACDSHWGPNDCYFCDGRAEWSRPHWQAKESTEYFRQLRGL